MADLEQAPKNSRIQNYNYYYLEGAPGWLSR